MARFCEACVEPDLFHNGEVASVQPEDSVLLVVEPGKKCCGFEKENMFTLLMVEILHHVGCMKPYK